MALAPGVKHSADHSQGNEVAYRLYLREIPRTIKRGDPLIQTALRIGIPTRQMASGSFRLNYNLYRDAARSTVWGDGTSGTSTLFDSYQLPGAGTVNRDYPIYARTFSQQSVGIGVYQDVITVTVDY